MIIDCRDTMHKGLDAGASECLIYCSIVISNEVFSKTSVCNMLNVVV